MTGQALRTRITRRKSVNIEFFRLEEAADKPPTRTIIEFDSGRKAQKARSEERQRCAALLEHGRLPCRLPEDWLEFVVTMALFFALLFGFYVGLP